MALRDVRQIGGMNPQFQAQYDEEQRRMELAKALMAQGQRSPMEYLEQPRTAQSAKLGWGAMIAPAIQAALGAWQQKKAAGGMAAAQQANANEISQGQTEFNSAPDKKAAIAKLIASMNPGLQSFGREQQAREDERLKTVTDMQAKISASDAIATYLAGDPNMARGSQFPEPTVASAPGPDGRQVPYLVNTMDGGRKQGTSIGLPSNVSVDTAGEKAGITALGKKLPEIAEKTMTTMQGAVKALDDAERIYSLANDPEVTTGALAEPEIFLRNLAVKLGGSGAEGVAKTQALVSSIAEQTLDASIDLKGAITDKEWPRLAQARAGEISYTPAALKTLAQIQRAKEFNKYIQALNQRESGKKNGVGGIEANLAMFPAPALGSRVFPEEEFGSRPDGTVFYKGSTEPLFGGNKRVPATAPTGPGVKPIKSMSKAEIEAEIKALEAELFGGRK